MNQTFCPDSYLMFQIKRKIINCPSFFALQDAFINNFYEVVIKYLKVLFCVPLFLQQNQIINSLDICDIVL